MKREPVLNVTLPTNSLHGLYGTRCDLPDVLTSVVLSDTPEPTATDLSLEVRRILVRETQFPSINPLPTVGVDPFLQAAYSEQANQWTTSPCTNTTTHLKNYLYSA